MSLEHPPVLSCSQLSWRHQGATILEGVDLHVHVGESLALVGPNGSGKSTLIKLLSGVLAPSAGEVQLFGRPLSDYLRRDIAQRIAVVEQHSETLDAISVRDAVELGRTPWLSALAPWSADDDRHVEQALQAVDLGHLSKRRWHSLSGGERQRAQIGRAMAQQPQILLLDEPTNHLDIQHQLSILGLVQRLPVTTVIALHDLNQALTCDRVAVLDKGRLIALGTPEEVLVPALLLQTFGVHAHYLIDPEDGTRVLRFRPAG
jgi:iron complex transport system ATP-binding protein